MILGPERIALLVAAVLAVTVLVLARADRRLAGVWETFARLATSFGVMALYASEGLRRRLAGERGLGPELVRRAFEDLGPTYLKLAQLVASSQGLFPESYCREFSKTLDRVKPFPFVEVRSIVEAELGATLEELFASVDPQPLASASIAQVHAARMHDGREVVLKIQRPRIERRIAADMRILRLGAQAMAVVPRLELANPVAIIDDFSRTLGEELDFEREARNMDEFNAIMAELHHPDVRAPRVERALSTRRVITMERFYGVRVDDVEGVRARSLEGDTESRLVYGLRAWFQCMILYGFFHGDVHAGNLMLLDAKEGEQPALGFLDFGIIGRFSPKIRRQITDYIVAFSMGDYRRLGEVLLSMDAVQSGVDLDRMAKDLERAYAPMLKLSFGDIKYGDVLPEILRVSVKHRMRLPREFVLVTKQMLYFDRYAKLLAPRLNIFSDPRLVAAITEDVIRARQANDNAA
jgi:predicted unusual protein kinase regulating ubiquinone biosynthesis (AarF/ABC1/UbiB family)